MGVDAALPALQVRQDLDRRSRGHRAHLVVTVQPSGHVHGDRPVCTVAVDRPGSRTTLRRSAADASADGAAVRRPGGVSPDRACKRGTRAYPYLHQSGVSTTFVACAGYNINEVRGAQPSAMADAALVTLTVGGNDIGFSTVVSSCTAFTSNATCTDAVNSAVAKIGIRDQGMEANLITLLRDIRGRAPNATIVLLGYPHLYATGSTCGLGQPSQVKRKAMFDGGELLNTALKDAVDATGDPGTLWVDVRPVFAGRDICASGSRRWINGLVLFNSAESYHPNQAGHIGYRDALRNALSTARV